MAEHTPHKPKDTDAVSGSENTLGSRTPAHAYHLDGATQPGYLAPLTAATETSTVTILSPKRTIEPLKAPHSSRKSAQTAANRNHATGIAAGSGDAGTTLGGDSSGIHQQAFTSTHSPNIQMEELGSPISDISSLVGSNRPESDSIDTNTSSSVAPIAYISTVARTTLPGPSGAGGLSVPDAVTSEVQVHSAHAVATSVVDPQTLVGNEVLYHSRSYVGVIEEKATQGTNLHPGHNSDVSDSRYQSLPPPDSQSQSSATSSTKRVYGDTRNASSDSFHKASGGYDSHLALEYTRINTVSTSSTGLHKDPQDVAPKLPAYYSNNAELSQHGYAHPTLSHSDTVVTVGPVPWTSSRNDSVLPAHGVPIPLSQSTLDDSDDEEDAIYGLGPVAGVHNRERQGGCWSACFGKRGYCGSCCLVKRLRKCECDRVRSHCYFMCCFVLYLAISSLARFLVFADALVHVILYALTVADGGLFSYLQDDLRQYTFETSVADLLLLSLSRSVILFFAYAYRFHLSSPAILVSWMIMAFSVVYVVAKFITAYNSTFAPMLLFSLAICFFEWAIYVVVRRRRITAPTSVQQSSAATSSVHSAGVSVSRSVDVDKPSIYPSSPIPSSSKSYDVVSSVVESPTSTASGELRGQAAGSQRVGLGVSGTRALNGASTTTSTSTTLQSTLASVVNAASSASASSISTSLLRNDTDPLAPHQLADVNGYFATIDGVDVHYRLMVHPDILAAQAYDQQQRKQDQSEAGAEAPDALLSENKDSIMANAKKAASLPVLVLFHGLGGSTHSWDAVLPAIAPYSSVVLAFDRPGAGLTARPTRLPSPIILGNGSTCTHTASAADGSAGRTNVVAGTLPTTVSQFMHAQHELNVISALGIPIFPAPEAIPHRSVPPSLAPYFEAADRDNFMTAATSQLAAAGGALLAGSGSEEATRLAATSTWKRTQDLAEAEVETILNSGAGENPYRSDFTLRIMFALLRLHGITPSNCRNLVLLAHHSGAAHAIRCALACPRSVSALIFAAPNVFDDGIPSAVRSALRTRLGRGLVQQMLKTEIAAVALKRAWLDASKVPPAVIQFLRLQARLPGWQEAFVEMVGLPSETAPKSVLCSLEATANGRSPARSGTTPLMTAAAAAALAAQSASTPTNSALEGLGPFLGLIKCPVLILHGDQDRVVPFSASQKLAKAIVSSPSVSVATITHCGNVPHEESPVAFSEIVNDFMIQLTEARRRRFRMLSSNSPHGAVASGSSLATLPSQLPGVTVNAIASAASAESVTLPDLPPATITRISPSGVTVTVPTNVGDEDDDDRKRATSPQPNRGGNSLSSTSPLLTKARIRSDTSSFK